VPGGDFFYILKLDRTTHHRDEDEQHRRVGHEGHRAAGGLVIKTVSTCRPATGVRWRQRAVRLAGAHGDHRGERGRRRRAQLQGRHRRLGDTSLSLLQDTLVIESPVVQVLQGTTVTIDVPLTCPRSTG